MKIFKNRSLFGVVAAVVSLAGPLVVAVLGVAGHAAASAPTASQTLSGSAHANEHRQKSSSPVANLVLRGDLVVTVDAGLAERDADQCRSWKYDHSSQKKDLLAMKRVSTMQWGRRCYQYACSAVGEAEMEGRLYRVEVNAGGWISLDTPGEESTIWAAETQIPGFLAACNCCEDPAPDVPAGNRRR